MGKTSGENWKEKPPRCERKKLKDKSKVRNSPCASQHLSQLCSVSSCDSFLKPQPLGIRQFCIDLNFCCKKILAIIVGNNNLDSVASMHQKSLGAACL